MHILGFDKTTLLDYPEHIAATIFLGGCNMRCPFCHNSGMVYSNIDPLYTREQIFSYLLKRSNILEGVCITGGEPTLNNDLPTLISDLHSLGLKVKLDTNGTNPNLLYDLLQDHMIDYIAMDIKNSKEKYFITCGKNIPLSNIEKSVDLIKHCDIPYEFRTTVVKEFHTKNDFIQIGEWLKGASNYYLQPFVESNQVLLPNTFSSYSKEQLEQYKLLLCNYISNVSIRGYN